MTAMQIRKVTVTAEQLDRLLADVARVGEPAEWVVHTRQGANLEGTVVRLRVFLDARAERPEERVAAVVCAALEALPLAAGDDTASAPALPVTVVRAGDTMFYSASCLQPPYLDADSKSLVMRITLGDDLVQLLILPVPLGIVTYPSEGTRVAVAGIGILTEAVDTRIRLALPDEHFDALWAAAASSRSFGADRRRILPSAAFSLLVGP